MITKKTIIGFCNGCAVEVSELYGLSTDVKPMNEANGSTFTEMDTGSGFCFDAENKIWHKVF